MFKRGNELMNKIAKTSLGGKWLIIFAFMVLCVGMATTQASAVIQDRIHTFDNNFTMINGLGGQTGGMNDVEFIWDGTQRYSVATTNQVPNVAFSSDCFFLGNKWTTHDCVLYGPGTYTIYTACQGGSPGCGLVTPGFPPLTFTVGPNQVGVHYQFNWGSTFDIDMVNVFTRNVAFLPSPMCTSNPANGGGCPIPTCGGSSEKPNNWVWDLASIDVDGDGINGLPFVDGPFIGFSGNMSVMVGPGGLPPNVWPDKSPVDFGGSSKDIVLTLKNNGDSNLTITTVRAPADPFSIVAGTDTCSGATLAPNGTQQCTVTLRFTKPLTGSEWTTQLLIDSNDPGTPSRFILQAGNEPPNPFDLVSPADGATNVDPKSAFTWNLTTDPNGDRISYLVSICTDSTFASGDCAPATVVVSRDNKGMFYAGGAGLLMIGMTFFGGLKGRKRIVLLLVLAGLIVAGSGALLSCTTSDKSATAPAAPAGQASFIAPSLSSNTTYYWRVAADDGKATNNLTYSPPTPQGQPVVSRRFTTR